MTEKKETAQFLIFESLFWLTATAIFNAKQYTGGMVICLIFVIWYFASKTLEAKFLVLFSGLPFQAITKFSASVPSIAVVLYLCFIVESIIKRRFHVKWKVVVSVAALILLQIINCIRYNVQISSIVSALLAILFSAYVIEEFEDLEDPIDIYKMSAWVFSIAMLIDIYCIKLFPQLPYYILYTKQTILDRIGRFCALNGDPNYFGQLVVVAMGFMITLIVLYAKEHRFGMSLVGLATTVLLATNGMRSLSKGYVAGMAGVLMLAIWFFIMEGKSVKQKPIRFILFLVIGGAVAIQLMNNIIMPVISSRSETDLFTGRLDIWQNYFEMFSDHFDAVFTGMGFANSPVVVQRYMGIAEAAHNLYIEIFGDLGIIGITAVGMLWSSVLAKGRTLVNNISSLFIWGFLITSFSLSASANDLMYFVVPILILVFSIDSVNSLSESENEEKI